MARQFKSEGEKRAYSTWRHMKHRCGKAKLKYWENTSYDARWDKFDNFLKDMGNRPLGASLDRIDPFGDYCKANCRWATPYVQNNNKRNNRRYWYNGSLMTLVQFAQYYGVSLSNLKNKIYLSKLDINEALTYLIRKKGDRNGAKKNVLAEDR